MKQLKLKIEGMHCSSCSMLIKDALEEQNGIMSAEISDKKGEGKIDYDEEKVNEDKIIDIVSNEGYKADKI